MLALENVVRFPLYALFIYKLIPWANFFLLSDHSLLSYEGS